MVICEGDLMVKSKLHSLKIKDELQSRNSTSPQYLAFSVVENDNTSVSAGVSDYHGTNISSVQSEEDDIFKDALPDFISLSESCIHPHSMAMNQSARSGDVIDSTGLGSTDALMNENDLGKGMGFSDDIFYEAQGMESSDFVSVTFSTRSSASPDYDGIDTQVCNKRMRAGERWTQSGEDSSFLQNSLFTSYDLFSPLMLLSIFRWL